MIVRYLGLAPYQEVYEEMKHFTESRTEETPDELWVVEHPPVYTQGQNGKPEHILNPAMIPIVQVDRGGQVTYHGPGQLVVYTLIDFKKRGCGVRSLIRALENAVIATLADYGIEGCGNVSAPGVYVDGKKIAALGLRIRKGSVYHGLSLNVAMDLTPFSGINPCGYQGLEVIQMIDLLPTVTLPEVTKDLVRHLEYYLDPVQLQHISTTANKIKSSES